MRSLSPYLLTRIYAALKGSRAVIDLIALERILVYFSLLVVEQRWIKGIDINPLLVSSQKYLALSLAAYRYASFRLSTASTNTILSCASTE
jgi:hypothetical protein